MKDESSDFPEDEDDDSIYLEVGDTGDMDLSQELGHGFVNPEDTEKRLQPSERNPVNLDYEETLEDIDYNPEDDFIEVFYTHLESNWNLEPMNAKRIASTVYGKTKSEVESDKVADRNNVKIWAEEALENSKYQFTPHKSYSEIRDGEAVPDESYDDLVADCKDVIEAAFEGDIKRPEYLTAL